MRRFWDISAAAKGAGDPEGHYAERDNEVRNHFSVLKGTRVLLKHLQRLVSRQERSLRSTVVKCQQLRTGRVKCQTAQNRAPEGLPGEGVPA